MAVIFSVTLPYSGGEGGDGLQYVIVLCPDHTQLYFYFISDHNQKT